MIQLQANAELRQTFETLIGTMKAPVRWNGVFVVIDNYLILQGEVRSLFFHFDTRKVTTNIIEIPAPEGGAPKEIGSNVRVQNAINMVLYAFGKWGTIKGLRVDKSFAQLSQLFVGILREIDVEPEYTQEYMRFYRTGMRMTYEDVIQTALEYQEKDAEENRAEGGGLWHKILWKKRQAAFLPVETTLRERRKARLGNNFYMVGYLCPTCGEKLHMAVYPMGKEFRIETEEGGVLCARTCTCRACQCFYTPRPGKLLAEGDVYTIEFGEDDRAYEDYLKLLGRDGDRVSNYRCNVFADGRSTPETEEEELEELVKNLPELSDRELARLSARMEEGFYPDESIERVEERVRRQGRSRRGRREQGGTKTEAVREHAAGAGRTRRVTDAGAGGAHRQGSGPSVKHAGERGSSSAVPGEPSADPLRPGKSSREAAAGAADGAQEEAVRKYTARMEKLDRYSGRQLRELKTQMERDASLSPAWRQEHIEKIERKLRAEQTEGMQRKVDACEGKSYAVVKRVYDEVAEADLPEEERASWLARLGAWMQTQAEREVGQLVAKMPPNPDRAQYRSYMERIHGYEGADLSPYEELFRERRAAAEKQEVANLVKRARKVSREDVKELLGKLQEGDFLPELVQPYIEKVEERLRQMDEEAIAEICPDPMKLSYEEGMEAYERIEQGDFLPELKTNALKMLSRRLSKIKTDECELLGKKLLEELSEAGLGENPRHHFYPARRVLLGQATPEETELIDFALASYAAGRGPFEYPILVVDATKNGTGREGLILTPEHLYYSTLFSAYGMPVTSIRRIDASTGLLNRGLFVHQENGTKTKLPHAVETKELPAFAGVLDAFVRYLREKPDSRNVAYLAREKHETICCFRCGFEYQGGGICPKCGYQNNG